MLNELMRFLDSFVSGGSINAAQAFNIMQSPVSGFGEEEQSAGTASLELATLKASIMSYAAGQGIISPNFAAGFMAMWLHFFKDIFNDVARRVSTLANAFWSSQTFTDLSNWIKGQVSYVTDVFWQYKTSGLLGRCLRTGWTSGTEDYNVYAMVVGQDP